MLVMAVHTVSAVTAKVPFSMMMLIDHIKKKEIPPELHCRQVAPTSGLRSTSLWDVQSVAALKEWLDEFLDVDCTNEVFEVQEDFSYGLAVELGRVRAADRVNESTKAATAAASKQMTELDARFHVSEQAASVAKAAREASAVAATRTAAVLARFNTAARTNYSKAMENERVAAAATSLNTGMTTSWKNLTQGVEFLKAKVVKNGEAQSPHSQTSQGTEAGRPLGSLTSVSGSASVAPSKGSGSDGYEGLATEARVASTSAPHAYAAPAVPAASVQGSAPPAPPAAKPMAAPEDKSLFTLDDLESDDDHNDPSHHRLGELTDLHLSPAAPRAPGGFDAKA